MKKNTFYINEYCEYTTEYEKKNTNIYLLYSICNLFVLNDEKKNWPDKVPQGLKVSLSGNVSILKNILEKCYKAKLLILRSF